MNHLQSRTPKMIDARVPRLLGLCYRDFATTRAAKTNATAADAWFVVALCRLLFAIQQRFPAFRVADEETCKTNMRVFICSFDTRATQILDMLCQDGDLYTQLQAKFPKTTCVTDDGILLVAQPRLQKALENVFVQSGGRVTVTRRRKFRMDVSKSMPGIPVVLLMSLENKFLARITVRCREQLLWDCGSERHFCRCQLGIGQWEKLRLRSCTNTIARACRCKFYCIPPRPLMEHRLIITGNDFGTTKATGCCSATRHFK